MGFPFLLGDSFLVLFVLRATWTFTPGPGPCTTCSLHASNAVASSCPGSSSNLIGRSLTSSTVATAFFSGCTARTELPALERCCHRGPRRPARSDAPGTPLAAGRPFARPAPSGPACAFLGPGRPIQQRSERSARVRPDAAPHCRLQSAGRLAGGCRRPAPSVPYRAPGTYS